MLIDMAYPSRDVLEELALASGPSERPVAIFVGRSGKGMTRAAIEAGISASVVDAAITIMNYMIWNEIPSAGGDLVGAKIHATHHMTSPELDRGAGPAPVAVAAG